MSQYHLGASVRGIGVRGIRADLLCDPVRNGWVRLLPVSGFQPREVFDSLFHRKKLEVLLEAVAEIRFIP